MVRNIPDEPYFVPVEFPQAFEVDDQKIRDENRDIGGCECRSQVFDDAPVDFDEDEMFHVAGEMTRQRAPSRPDLHDNVAGLRMKAFDNFPDDVFIDKKVLAKGLAGVGGGSFFHPSALLWDERVENPLQASWRVV